MAQNVTILGANYSAVPAIELPKTGGGTARFDDASVTTAVASDVASGKIFLAANGTITTGTNSGGGGGGNVWQDQQGYVHLDDQPGSSVNVVPLSVTSNGTYTAQAGEAYSPVTVNVSGGGYSTLKKGVIRPDAELVDSWSGDDWVVDDLGITIPAYSTSNQTLKTSTRLIELPFDASYDYFVAARTLTIPKYSSDTKSSAKEEYAFSTLGAEVVVVRANSVPSLDGSKYWDSYMGSVISAASNLITYWTSSSAISVAATSYGAYQSINLPTYGSFVIQVGSPSYMLRGSTTYLNSTNWALLTDIRYQWIVELYRAKRGDMGISGWQTESQRSSILDNIINNGGVLT